MRRRSSRLASASKVAEAAAATPKLSSLAERDESPDVNEAAQSLNAIVSPGPEPQTPGHSTPFKPPMSEMHPSKVHHTMAPPSSGLRLGFTDIKSTTTSGTRDHSSGDVQSTPSRIGAPPPSTSKISMPPSSPFFCSFARDVKGSDMKLGAEAQRMMEEIREDAQRIKADLAAKQALGRAAEKQAGDRKIAKAKGKTGRFSAAHLVEFKKMDSIESHPSLHRTARTAPTPLKQGVKRTQSKANLDDEREPPKSACKRLQPRVNLDDAPEAVCSTLRTPGSSLLQATNRLATESWLPSKRAKQHMDEDASCSRPASKDGSMLPRPKSAGKDAGIPRSKSMAALMTPTTPSLVRAASIEMPGHGSRADTLVTSSLGEVLHSVTTNNVAALRKEPEQQKAQQPEARGSAIKTPSASRLARVKSILRGTRPSSLKPSTAFSSTASRLSGQKPLLELPSMTPGGDKKAQLAHFTPETRRLMATLDSPSPAKSVIAPSKSRQAPGELSYPSLDTTMIEAEEDGSATLYPDLSRRRPLPEPPVMDAKGTVEHIGPVPASIFTFRHDHTIRFSRTSSPGFGVSSGLASVRRARPSILPTARMPGSFPTSQSLSAGADSSPDKENEVPGPHFPIVLAAVPHGMANKKRVRASTDEEDAERAAAEKARKKRKQESVPQGDALLAPRLVGATKASSSTLATPRKGTLLRVPGSASGPAVTPSPMKKPKLSLSRLNMLARPKTRK